MEKYFGIDFGTTNSAVVTIIEMEDGNISVKNIGEENRPLPSFVAINEETGEVKAGLEAKKNISEEDHYIVFSSIKSVIDCDKEWNIAGKVWTPIEIAAELFKELKRKTKEVIQMDLNKAVLAVPVGFSSKKKNSVRRAAQKAGIDITMFISEPTAAYCSRADELKAYKNVAVFDWGGGTLDVVVLRVDKGVINELSAVGIKMAGNDIDKNLAERICQKISHKQEDGKEFSFDDLSPKFQLKLLNACENAKCSLADEDVAVMKFARFDQYGRVLEKIDYDFFSVVIEQQVEEAFNCLLKGLSEAKMNKETIDCILCVGGSSRLRPLQEKMIKYFDRDKIIFPRQAMWDIGGGAAQIAYRPGCYTLNKPIGVQLSDDRFYPLLEAGQRLPTEEKEVRFGVVNYTENGKGEARFIMMDDGKYIECFKVKLRGFSDEVLKVWCYVDSDMIFKMKVTSNYSPDDVFRVWSYDNLKISYDIEGAYNEK